MTPAEALQAADLDWEVQTVRPSWTIGDFTQESTTSQISVRLARPGRMDRKGKPETHIELAKVGPDYQPIQNREMFEIASAGAGENLLLESAGSVRNGKQVFALLKSDSFVVGKADEIHRYLLLAMGHDGELTLRAIPTSVRVACSNTLRMVLKGKQYHAIRHTGNMDVRKQELVRIIAQFRQTGVMFQEKVEALQRKTLREKELSAFWQAAWQTINGEEADASARKAVETLESWQTRMEIERMELGEDVNLWLAMNAVTYSLQHKESGKATNDPVKTQDRRLQDNLIGLSSLRTQQVYQLAYATL